MWKPPSLRACSGMTPHKVLQTHHGPSPITLPTPTTTSWHARPIHVRLGLFVLARTLLAILAAPKPTAQMPFRSHLLPRRSGRMVPIGYHHRTEMAAQFLRSRLPNIGIECST